VARRIVERVHWLAENLAGVHLETLTGEFEGLYKLRVGDYRVVYELIHGEQLIIIHAIGHRREIYRRR
jgi:mRNA interferase RelE/StbE